jgi:hypothetical protein
METGREKSLKFIAGPMITEKMEENIFLKPNRLVRMKVNINLALSLSINGEGKEE